MQVIYQRKCIDYMSLKDNNLKKVLDNINFVEYNSKLINKFLIGGVTMLNHINSTGNTVMMFVPMFTWHSNGLTLSYPYRSI